MATKIRKQKKALDCPFCHRKFRAWSMEEVRAKRMKHVITQHGQDEQEGQTVDRTDLEDIADILVGPEHDPEADEA